MRALIAAGALLVSACLPFAGTSWKNAERALRPGDLVRVETRQGTQHQFRVTKVEDKAFYGVASDNESYRVPHGALKWLQVRRDDTTWVSLGIVESAVAGEVIRLMLTDGLHGL